MPTDEGRFVATHTGHGPTYASQFLGGWAQYRALLLDDLAIVLPRFVRLGVNIVASVTLPSLRRALMNYPVVIMLAHWNADRVEMGDGWVPVDDLVEAVPTDFAGVIDLCVCRPVGLVDALHARRTRCLAKYLPIDVVPTIWLYFYRTVFTELHRNPSSYIEALDKVAMAYLERTRPKPGVHSCQP